MNQTGMVSLLIIIANFIVSYQGFKSTGFFAKYEFEVEKILVYKDYRRLVTSLFLHVNWQHLIFNMISLLFFSFTLESSLGSWQLLLVYFVSGVGGDLLALLIHRHDGAYSSVGASGAINGLIFASIALFPSLQVFFLPGWLFGIIYVAFSIYGIHSKKNNIGHESHLGGAVIGMLMAVALKPSILVSNWWTILLVLVPTGVFMYIIVKKPQLLLVDNLFHKSNYNYTVDDRYNVQKSNTQQEVDRILEKIHKKGINSLSKKEKEMLDEYAKK
jgi:membrane associated rhomboid family serine protease